jgi:hypothetical protein
MPVDQVHGPVDHDQVVVYGSTVDHGWWWLKGSPELALGAAPMSGSSPAVGEKEKGAPVVPTVGEGGRCGAGGRLAAKKQIGGGFFSWTQSMELMEAMRNVAKVCGEAGGVVQGLL